MIRLFLLMLVLVAAVAGCSGEKQQAPPPTANFMTEGSQAKDFTLKTVDGKSVTLSGLRGKPVVLNFWASWCPPCRKEMPVLKNAASTYEGKVHFIGINIQDSSKTFREALKEFDLSYPNGQDEDLAISQAYGVMALPKTFFINKEGIISYVHAGGIDEGTLTTILQKISR